jgi:hypothetical protein
MLGIVVPPTICCIEFKTIKELSLLPVTLVERRHDLTDDSDGSSCSSDEGEEDALTGKKGPRKTRRRLAGRERKTRYSY